MDPRTPAGDPGSHTPAPQASNQMPSLEVAGPEIIMPKVRLVNLHLVTSEIDAPCSFWVGLAPQGTHAPAKLMDLTSIGTLLTEAAKNGVSDGGPLMLSDTSVSPPRYVYLLPLPSESLVERAQWIHDLVSTVRSWSPDSAGFYIAPDLLEAPLAIELLLAVLTESVHLAPTRDYYLLTGAYGLNSLLNAALRLKNDLDTDKLNLHVFH